MDSCLESDLRAGRPRSAQVDLYLWIHFGGGARARKGLLEGNEDVDVTSV